MIPVILDYIVRHFGKKAEMKKIRIGVVGTGYLGSVHAKIYREIPGCELQAICDINPENRARVSGELGVPGFSDHRQMFGKVDAVSIAVPTGLHHAVCRDFLRAGIHCLVEKPFTTTLRQADELIRLASRRKLILQVGHVERFNSAFTSTQALFKDPYFIECHRLSLFPRRSLDIGVVLDLMIHDIDIILGLVHSPIRRIEAVGVNVLTPYEDIANARITFRNGCVCNLTASRISDEVMRKIRIFLKDAYISLDYKDQHAFIYRKTPGGISKDALPIEKEQPLQKELASFIECVAGGLAPLIGGKEARQALAVALRIRDLIWKKAPKFS